MAAYSGQMARTILIPGEQSIHTRRQLKNRRIRFGRDLSVRRYVFSNWVIVRQIGETLSGKRAWRVVRDRRLSR